MHFKINAMLSLLPVNGVDHVFMFITRQTRAQPPCYETDDRRFSLLDLFEGRGGSERGHILSESTKHWRCGHSSR